jgi:hypothetical protein
MQDMVQSQGTPSGRWSFPMRTKERILFVACPLNPCENLLVLPWEKGLTGDAILPVLCLKTGEDRASRVSDSRDFFGIHGIHIGLKSAR